MSDETGDRGDAGDAGDAMSNNTSDTGDTGATTSTVDAPWESPYRITTEAWAQAARDLGVDLDAVRSTATHGRSRPALRLARPNRSNSPRDLDALTLRTPWALALQAAGRLGPAVGEGRYAVWCLNDAAHSTPRGSLDAVDSSCVLLPPDPVAGHGALLTCAHAHCEHLQADDWLGMLVRDFGEEVWTEAVAEAARVEKGEPEERGAQTEKGEPVTVGATDRPRPRIVVQRRAVQRDDMGRVVGAALVRATVPDLARQGFDALAGAPWGERVFALENSNPPRMVHVLEPESDEVGGKERRARIVGTSRAVLRGWFSGAAAWVAEGAGKNGNEAHESDPPDAVVTFALESCEGLRTLAGVTECPVMRRDGSILAAPGYDPATRLYAAFDASAARAMLDAIPECPTQTDAARALATLHELVRDFPFERPMHRDTWVAGFLTMLARDVFAGTTPLFLARANTRGSGKTLLTEIPHILVTGERPAMLVWTGDEIEFEKTVTAEAIAGSSCVIIDNITGLLKSATLDRLLTSGRHRARILGGNQCFDGPMRAVWWGSGNNVETSDDMARRIAPVELVSTEERPENREGFAADADDADGETGTAALRARARRDRWHYLGAGLTLLRAWHVAGRPGKNLPAWGSFESWSRVVRGAIVHAGGADPGEAHEVFRDQASADVGQLRGILAGWESATRDKILAPSGETVGRAVKRLVQERVQAEHEKRRERGTELREALESINGGEPLERWRGDHTSRVGKFLRANRRKVSRVGAESMMFEVSGETGGSARWKVTKPIQTQTAGQRGDEGDRGDASNPPRCGKRFLPVGGMEHPTYSTYPPSDRDKSSNSYSYSEESVDDPESDPIEDEERAAIRAEDGDSDTCGDAP